MKSSHIIFLSVLFFSCGKAIQNDREDLSSKWKMNDWIPFVLVEDDSSNYFKVYGPNTNTLYAGDEFSAKLFIPIREFYDSLGNNTIKENHEMSFVIYADTMTNNVYPPQIDMKKYLEVIKDTGYLHLPVDSIYSKVKWDSVKWEFSISPIEDSTYVVGGQWIIDTKIPSH